MAIRNVRTVALGERYRGSTDAIAGPALVPFAVLFAGATSWLAKTGEEPQDTGPTRQSTAMIGWKTPLNRIGRIPLLVEAQFEARETLATTIMRRSTASRGNSG
jgi:hypothetical protein